MSPSTGRRWPLRPLVELADNFDAKRVPVREADRKRGPYPYYGASGAVDYVDSYLFDGDYLLIGEDGENLRTRQTPIAFLATGKFWVNNHAHILQGKKHAALTRYLAYAVEASDISGYLSGSTMPKLTQGNLNRLMVPAPPPAMQERIVDVLGSLDGKIALNHRLCAILEAMAGALFKSWFVDFDPVRAKAAGKRTGLPKEIEKLFPNKLVKTRLGPIPEGWTVASLADHFQAVKGVSYKGSGLEDSGMPLHNLNSVKEGGGYKYSGIKYYSGEYADRHVVQPGDLIVANTEQGHDRLLIGYAALVPNSFGDRGIASHHIYIMRPKSSSAVTPTYLCRLLNSPKMHDVVSGYANGTTVNMLPIDGVQSPTFACPPGNLIAIADEYWKTSGQRCEKTTNENQALVTIRNLLLPQLVSGDLFLGGL